MGLDNYPKTYPCVKEGVAVYTNENGGDHTIDCNATRAAGVCPWERDMKDIDGAVVGMLGAPCWYRGRSGNWMLELLAVHGREQPPHTFYGAGVEGDAGLAPSESLELSEWMGDHAEQFAQLTYTAMRGDGLSEADIAGQMPDAINRYRYATKWLAWCANYDGVEAWW